jgi:hypothetical protein
VISLIVILYIYFTIGLTSTTKAWIGWAVLGAAILIGVVIGLLCSKFARIGATLIALWGGFLFGILLNEAFFYNTSVGYIFWIISVAAALIMAGLVFVVYNHVVILSTSFVGAYLFVRGISLWAGGYPNEYILMKEIKSGIVVTVPLSYYFYLGGIFVATAICAYIQYRQFRLKSLEESRPYERLR